MTDNQNVGDRHGAGQLPERARLRRRLGSGLPAVVAAGPRRRRHRHVLHDRRCRPATTRRRSPSTRRGTRTTAPAARRTAPTSPSPSAGSATSSRSATTSDAATCSTSRVDPGRAGGRRRARARAGPPSVRRRGPLLHDPRPVQRRRPAQQLRRLRRRLRRRTTRRRTCSRTATCPSDKGYYHGGDIEGLRRKLPVPRGPRHQRDLGRADLRQPDRAAGHHQPLRPFVRLPRLLDPRLPRRRSAPRDERRVRAARRRGPRPRHQGASWTSSRTTPPT